MSLKACATSCCSRCALDLGACAQVARLDAARAGGELSQRTRERLRENPGQGQPEQERERADPDQREHAAAHAIVDRFDALRHPDGADGLLVLIHHRHRRVEDVGAQLVAVTLTLRAEARERQPDLGAARIRRLEQLRPGRVGPEDAPTVDDDDACPEVASGLLGQALQVRRRLAMLPDAPAATTKACEAASFLTSASTRRAMFNASGTSRATMISSRM